jgi:hypothetical protein
MLKKGSLIILVILTLIGCNQNNEYVQKLEDPELFHGVMKKLTDIIVHDIFSPPVASRVYSYPSIAAYETVRFTHSNKYNTLSGQLNGLSEVPTPKDEHINFNLAAIHAFYIVGKELIFSQYKFDDYQNKLYDELILAGLPKKTLDTSKSFGKEVATHILKWAEKDLYKQTRTYEKYSILPEEKYWKPTPPDYMEGIEPHWRKIRTMVLDSANQFVPKPPLEVNLNKKSPFYKQLLEVYNTGVNLTDEQLEIAKFWDCNPYVSHHLGHAMFVTKKITPGGHWVGITAIASRISNSNFEDTISAYTNVTIALFDGFISCWDEKWRSILVRPETIINQNLDEEWLPLLQTPPFPEYTSGHSVISRSAAEVLTNLFGEDFEFLDTSEQEFGLPSREFKSFKHASDEAALSRLYGGIHYRMAIDEGVWQGEKVGEFIIKNLQIKNN